MKKLNQYILEKLRINKDSKSCLNIHDVEEYIQKFSERGMQYKKYFTTSINDDELTLNIKPIHRLSTTRHFDKFKKLAVNITLYLEDKLKIFIGGIVDDDNIYNRHKEKPRQLYIGINYKLETITVTLNK